MRTFAITLLCLLWTIVAQAQRTATTNDVIGSWHNGAEMGGTTLVVNSNYTYKTTDDHMGHTIETGTWVYTRDGKLTLTSSNGNVHKFWYLHQANVGDITRNCLTEEQTDLYTSLGTYGTGFDICFLKTSE